MKLAIQNTLVLLVSLGVALLIAEGILSVLWPQNLSGTWRVETNTGLRVNKSSGHARHQFGDRVVTYTFAAPHLRGPRPEAASTVLVLGDSFTFGWLLDDEDTYVHRMQERLDAEFGSGMFALLNAAAGGWGTGDYVAFVEEYGDDIEPDVILVFLNTDDIGRAMRSPLWTFDPDGEGMLSRTPGAHTEAKSVANALPGYPWLLEHSHLVQVIRTAVLNRGRRARLGSTPPRRAAFAGPNSASRHFEQNEAEIEEAQALGAAMFRRLHAWCERRGVALLVSTTGWHQPPYTLSEPTRAFLVEAPTLWTHLGIPFSDPSPEVWAERRRDPVAYVIPHDEHPNEAGAALIAEHTFPFLLAQLRAHCQAAGPC